MTVFAIAMLPAAARADYRSAVLADSPSAYWRLGETSGTAAADLSGNANGGTYAGGVALNQPGAIPGDTNTAARFDGVDDSVNVPDSNSLDMPTGVTVELWVKRTKKAWQVLVGKPGNSQNKLENYSVWLDQANTVRAYFGNGSSNASVNGATPLDTNWHHVAATYDNATARIYIDGVLNASKTSSVTMAANAQPLSIGRETATAANFFGGTLDEVAVYNRALTAAQLKAHYDATIVDITPPVVTLTQPPNGATTTGTPTYGGAAGTATGDSATVTVKVYSGTSPTGLPVQTLNATRTGAVWTTSSLVPLLDGTYTARAEQSDAAGNTGLSSPSTFTVDASAPAVTLGAPADGTLTSDPRPAYSGAAGNATGDSQTVTVKVYAGTTATGTPVQTLPTTRTGAAWAVTPATALADGTYTARAEQSDAAGNLGLSSSSTFTVDTTAPGVTLTQPADGSALATATPHLAGAAGNAAGDASSVTVDVYAGTTATGTPVQSLSVARSGGAWGADSAALGDGTYTARASQADAAANTGRSAAVTFTVDTVAPVVTLTSPAGGAALTSSRPAFSGAADGSTSVTVRIYAGPDTSGTLEQTLAATPSGGSWTVTPATPLADGVHTARAAQTDAAGNTGSSATSTFSIDSAAPAVTLTQPAGGFVATATPHFAGAAGNATGDSPLVTVDVYSGGSATGSPVQSLAATRSGAAWGIDAAALAEGTYTARATQTDDHGNTGRSADVTFTIDTVAPLVTITQPTSGATVADPQLAGAAESGSVTVKVYAGTAATGTPVATLTGGGPSWQVTPTLADGTYTALAQQTDGAGNTGRSAAVTFTLDTVVPDTTPPVVTIGQPADGSTTNDATPPFAGTAGDAAGDSATVTLRVYAGTTATGSPIRTVTTTRTGTAWTTDVAALADGVYTARAQQDDTAGNTGLSTAVSFTVNTVAPDTTPPVVTLTQPADGAVSGSHTPTFSGAAGTEATDNAAVTVKVYAGSTATGLPVQTLSTSRTGGSWSVTPISPLLDGTYTARAEQGDAAGNTGQSGAATFVVDTAAPAVTLTQPADGARTNAPSITGTAEAGTVTVKVYAGTTATGSPVQTLTGTGPNWHVTPTLADGTYTTRAEQTDAAGNTGQSGTATFVVDTAAPAVTLTQPADGAHTKAPSFAGTAEAGTVTVKVYAGTTATGSPVQTLTGSGPSWTATPSTLADGTYTARAEQTDAAGNTGQSAAATFVVDTAAPAVTLTQPATGSTVTDNRPAFAGAADGATTVTVKVYAGTSATGSPVQTLFATPSGSSWTVTPATALADGTYTARAEQTDAAGNTGLSGTSTFTVNTVAPDTTPPAVTLTQPADGATTNVARPAFAGVAGTDAGDNATVTVKIYAGTTATGSPVDTLNTTRTGASWTVTPANALSDGTYTARAEQSDAAGNTGHSGTATFVVDTAAPAVTLAQPPDGTTGNNPRPSFGGASGNASGDSQNVTVKVYAGTSPNGAPVQTLSTARTGATWTVAPALALADGTYTARAEQTDGAGNTGLSGSSTFTIDTAAPAVTLTAPANGSTSTDATPALSGAAGAAGGDSTIVTARIYAGSSATGTPVQTLNVTRAGASWTAAPAPLADGTYTARAEQADSAGNTGFSAASTFVVSVPPPANTAYRDTVLSDNPRGYWRLGEATGATAADASPNANNGTYLNGVTLARPGTINGDANTAVQLDGVNDSISVPDANSLDLTTGITLEAWVKRAKAGWQVIAGKPGNGQSRLENYSMWFDSSNFLRGFFGNGTTYVTVSSTTAIDTNWHHLVVTYDNATARLYIDGTQNNTAAGAVQMAGNADPFMIGRDTGNTYFLGATVDDVAVYPAALSANRIRAHYDTGTANDTTGPAVTLTTPADGSSTGDGRPAFSGTAGTATGDSQTVTVKIYAGTSVGGTPVQTLTTTRSGGSWSVQPTTALSGGTYTARAEQADGAGNTGFSAASTFTVDTTAPGVAMTRPTDGSSISEIRPTFAGEAGALAGDSPTVTVKVYAGSTATGSPLQTLTTSRSDASWLAQANADLALGTYTAVAQQADAAGNTGTSDPVTFTIVDTPPQTSSAYRDEVMADSPRAYWRLGETSGTVATDESGNHNNGSYVGGVLLNQPGRITGDTDPGVSFDGVNDYMTVPDSASLDVSTGATVETWMKRSKSGWQVVVGKPGNGQSRLENYAIWIDSGNFLRAFFGDGTNYATVTGAAAIDTNWHHVVTTYDNATVKLFIDGVLNASATSTVHLTPNTSIVQIGREIGNTFYYGGRLDDTAVYGTALSAARIQKHYETGNGIDTTPPAVTLSTPSASSSTIDTTPAYAGQAAITGTDSATVTVKVYAGSTATGTPVQTLSTTKYPTGSWSVSSTPALALGTYTAQAEQTDLAGNVGRSTARTFSITTRAAVGTDKEFIGAGDIAYCDDTGDEATALLLDQFPSATVFTLGDNAYESGTTSEFNNCYQPTWGRAKARTRPSIGDHDYADGADPNATGYFTYFAAQLAPFGASATDPARGYYSFDLGAWHVVALNPQCGDEAPTCNPATQVSWLQADLAAHPATCTVALMPAPRWSSGSIHGNNADVQNYWAALAAGGVDLYLAGDDHDYERFAPQTSTGAYDPNGMREIVVGTGGRSHYPFAGGVVRANSEVRNDDTYGILRLVLRPTRYEWEFVPQAGRTFMDSGSDTCH